MIPPHMPVPLARSSLSADIRSFAELHLEKAAAGGDALVARLVWLGDTAEGKLSGTEEILRYRFSSSSFSSFSSMKMGFEMDGMKVMVPSVPKDLVSEGHALHHCVGSYVGCMGCPSRYLIILWGVI